MRSCVPRARARYIHGLRHPCNLRLRSRCNRVYVCVCASGLQQQQRQWRWWARATLTPMTLVVVPIKLRPLANDAGAPRLSRNDNTARRKRVYVPSCIIVIPRHPACLRPDPLDAFWARERFGPRCLYICMYMARVLVHYLLLFGLL